LTKGNCYLENPGSSADVSYPIDIINALELTWDLPYAIPDDNIQAKLTCKTNIVNARNLFVF
jgi:hypothetical protein